MLSMGCAILATTLLAGPVVKSDPVAEAYPNWQNVTEKGLIAGRKVTPSDLRHKAVIVVEVEAGAKLKEQLILAAGFAKRCAMALNAGDSWETARLPRNLIEVISVHGPSARKDVATVLQAIKSSKVQGEAVVRDIEGNGCVVGEDLTFPGAPDNGGQYPFVYVLGPKGKEPFYKGVLKKDVRKDVDAAIEKAKAECETAGWRPYFGSVEEPKFHPQLAKALEKGKPLDPVVKAILKDVTSTDEAKAKESQILFDAINQTKSDLLLRIDLEATACPYRAVYDIQEVLKYWPGEKKSLDAVLLKIKASPDVEQLAKTFCRLKVWTDPDFVCRNANEAKKIVLELKKLRKANAKLKESKDMKVQNGAILMDVQMEELIETIPQKVK